MAQFTDLSEAEKRLLMERAANAIQQGNQLVVVVPMKWGRFRRGLLECKCCGCQFIQPSGACYDLVGGVKTWVGNLNATFVSIFDSKVAYPKVVYSLAWESQ